jgi:hypothetical protein
MILEVCMTHTMVAVPATQEGASFATFDRARFERDVVEPVRRFLEETRGSCTVHLYFIGGDKPDGEEVRPDTERREEGLPHHPKTPGSVAALECFKEEKGRGHLDIWVFTSERPFESFLTNRLKGQGAADVRILEPGQLNVLAAELAT